MVQRNTPWKFIKERDNQRAEKLFSPSLSPFHRTHQKQNCIVTISGFKTEIFEMHKFVVILFTQFVSEYGMNPITCTVIAVWLSCMWVLGASWIKTGSLWSTFKFSSGSVCSESVLFGRNSTARSSVLPLGLRFLSRLQQTEGRGEISKNQKTKYKNKGINFNYSLFSQF